MNWKNFNTNYRYNSKHNMHKIREMVREIMEEDVNPQTLDFLFRYNSRIYPKTTHVELDLPGEFEEVKDTAVFILNGTAKQLDYLEAVSKGGIVKRDALVNAEQQAGVLGFSKAVDIFEYSLFETIQEKRLCYPVVVTDHDYGVEYNDYEIEGRSFRIHFRIFNKEKINKILNTLKAKDYNNQVLSNTDYIRFVYCLIFASKDFAKEVIEELVYLFATIENISSTQQIDLFLAFKMIIKFRFGDDLKRKEELLEMVIKSVHESRHDELNGYEAKQKSIEELKMDYATLKAEMDNVISEKDNLIFEKDKVISEKDEVIEVINRDNETMQNELDEKNVWIEKAKKVLAKNHIFL